MSYIVAAGNVIRHFRNTDGDALNGLTPLTSTDANVEWKRNVLSHICLLSGLVGGSQGAEELLNYYKLLHKNKNQASKKAPRLMAASPQAQLRATQQGDVSLRPFCSLGSRDLPAIYIFCHILVRARLRLTCGAIQRLHLRQMLTIHSVQSK